MVDWESISNIILIVLAALGAFGSALWLSLVLWTFRDIRKRSRDPFAQILAAAVVVILNIPGLVIYLILRPTETLAEAYARSLEEEALLQSIEGKALCPGCGRAVRDHWQVCPYCHTKLKKVCVTCGELLELAWNICPHCTSAQLGYTGVEVAPSPAPAQQPAPVRRAPTPQSDAAPPAPSAKAEAAPSTTAPKRSSRRSARRRRTPRTDTVQFVEDDDF